MHNREIHIDSITRSGGFTLIEILVAVLVLSIGLLGLAGLQATSLRFNTDSSIQTQATYIANDVADRMRANSTVLNNYTANPTAATAKPCYTGVCSPADMADNDLFEWNTALQTLPAGQGAVTDLGGGLFQIRVMWDERRNGANGVGCNPNVLTDLRCLTITAQP